MKYIPMKHRDGDDFDAYMEELEQFDAGVEFKDDPEDVLQEVDRLLRKFGLEVIMPKDGTGNDTYVFSIRRRAK